jgi:cyclophilin family peptidyl-prolyl cis-trans isomerase
MPKHKYSLLFVLILIIAFMTYSCGGKKTETTDVNKKETQTQTTQKMDTTKPKTDTTSTKKDTTTSSKESDKVILETSMGNMTIELYPKDAPQHAANFKKLVKSKFYDGTTFHRVIAGFMIQGGDPNSKDDDRSNDGQGGTGYTIPAEIKLNHDKGSVAAARLGDPINPKRESSGCQFYIVTGEASHLNGQYTVFGKVIKGMDVADKIQKVKRDANDNPIEKIVIKKVYFAE